MTWRVIGWAPRAAEDPHLESLQTGSRNSSRRLQRRYCNFDRFAILGRERPIFAACEREDGVAVTTAEEQVGKEPGAFRSALPGPSALLQQIDGLIEAIAAAEIRAKKIQVDGAGREVQEGVVREERIPLPNSGPRRRSPESFAIAHGERPSETAP